MVKSTTKKIINIMEINKDDFQCLICFDIFMKPVTDLCGHTFCKNCIYNHLKVNSLCPLSKKNIIKPEIEEIELIYFFIFKKYSNSFKFCIIRNIDDKLYSNISKYFLELTNFEIILKKQYSDIFLNLDNKRLCKLSTSSNYFEEFCVNDLFENDNDNSS